MSDRFEAAEEDPIFETLGRALPRVTPSPELFERILHETAATPAQSPPVRRGRLPPPWRRWVPSLVAAAAGAVVAAAITLSLETSTPGVVSATAQVRSERAASPLVGVADLYNPTSAGGQLRVRLDNVPPPPRGSHYELWLLPHDSTQMTAVASFTPASHNITLDVPLPTPDQYAALDITIQRNDGSPTRSQTNLAGGTFTRDR